MDSRLTKNHKQHMGVDPLLSYIINNNNLIISTDGTTQTRKSGDSWIIALEDGTKIVSGNNPNFGPSEDITSYRTEVYACLASSLFLHLYSQFYIIEIKNKCKAMCSNPKYVRQLSWLLEDEYHHHGLYKSTEQEAISIILKMLPPNFKMEFIQGYQDKKTLYDRLPIKGKLNVDTKTYSKKTPLFQRIIIYSYHR